MATTRSKKSEQLAALEEKFKAAKGIAFTAFEALTVEEAQVIRRELRAQGMSYTVIKKTLIELAAKNASLPEVPSASLDGAVAVIVSSSDEIAPAAAIKKFRKDYKNMKTKEPKMSFAGAIFDGKFLSAEETARIADTPFREESLGKIVGMLRSGPQKLHGVFNSGFQKLYNVLQNAEKFASSNS
ncbi:50S ribosomal protein L10 [Candidatus Gracilibacteria bacterium]|nr:50S ribosomal protein L10 [Candidatus Gracilibacteria bacterium]